MRSTEVSVIVRLRTMGAILKTLEARSAGIIGRPAPRADEVIERRDVRLWPIADIPSCAAHVRFRGQSGHDRLREFAFAVAIGGKADVPLCTAYVR
jgi:hypothetical protein